MQFTWCHYIQTIISWICFIVIYGDIWEIKGEKDFFRFLTQIFSNSSSLSFKLTKYLTCVYERYISNNNIIVRCKCFFFKHELWRKNMQRGSSISEVTLWPTQSLSIEGFFSFPFPTLPSTSIKYSQTKLNFKNCITCIS